MLHEAAVTDQEEDEALGKENRGDELPEGLRGRQGRLARLKACKARLQSEDEEARHQAELARRKAIEHETGRRLVGRPPKPKAPTKNSLEANPTDPDSRVMKMKHTYLQGYNAQAVVAEDQIIVAASITQEPADTHQLHPMLHEARAELDAANIAGRIGVLLADSGYYTRGQPSDGEDG